VCFLPWKGLHRLIPEICFTNILGFSQSSQVNSHKYIMPNKIYHLNSFHLFVFTFYNVAARKMNITYVAYIHDLHYISVREFCGTVLSTLDQEAVFNIYKIPKTPRLVCYTLKQAGIFCHFCLLS
jgi:hypothetical protein